MKQLRIFRPLRRAIVVAALAAPLAAVTPARAADEKPAETADDTEYRNRVELSAANAWVRRDDAQFQQRNGVRADQPFGGISDLHLEQDLGKRGLFSLDGHFLYDNRDYLIKLGLADPELGFVRVGYNQYRTYYDGSGGYFPGNGQWFELYNDEMGVDRGTAWLETGLTLPEMPALTLRYEYGFRDGTKDSTSWADTGLTGGFGNRNIVPSFYDIDEKRHTIGLDGVHTLGNTEVGLGFRYERMDQDNTRVEHRVPGAAADRIITHEDTVESELFNGHGYVETRFSDNVMFTMGGSYTDIDSVPGGDRIYTPLTATPLSANDHGFVDLTGSTGVKQWVGNMSLMWIPREHLTIVPAFRVENQCQTGFSDYGEVAGTNAPVDVENVRSRDTLDVTESLEARYTGIKNLVLTARATATQGQGNLKETETEPDETPVLVLIHRDTDSRRFVQKYQLGANWYPHRRVNFAAQYYHQRKANEYTHKVDTNAVNTSGNRYPAYLTDQNFDTDDVNVRMTWRPVSRLTLVSRYDFQLSTIDTRADLLAQVQSSRAISHIFNQSISWTPWSRLYLQGVGTYAVNEVRTPANSITGTAAGQVSKSQNGYWFGSVMAGFVVSDRTDLQAQYTYYRASDYYNNFRVGQPYGANDEEHGVTVGIIFRINKNLRLTTRYGYFHYEDGASGGHNNFEAHMLASNLQYRF